MTESGVPGVSSAVVAYDRELIPWLLEHWAELFADLAAPCASASILDLACGSGLISRHLLDRLDTDGRIRGVDIDSEMLAYARSTLQDPRLSWHEADVGSLPFEDEAFDVVCCHQGLQFFPDPVAALAEVQRVLRPQGRVAIAVWGRLTDNPWPSALSSAVRSLLGDAAGESMLAVCRFGDPDDLATVLSNAAGLDEVAIHHHQRTASHPDITKAVAGQLAAMPSGSTVGDLQPEQQAELTALMCEQLANHTGLAGDLSVPSTCLLATATNPKGRPLQQLEE